MFLLWCQFLSQRLLFCSTPRLSQSVLQSRRQLRRIISAEQKKVFEGIVREYILENPEIISKRSSAFRTNSALLLQADHDMLVASKQELLNDPDAPWAAIQWAI